MMALTILSVAFGGMLSAPGSAFGAVTLSANPAPSATTISPPTPSDSTAGGRDPFLAPPPGSAATAPDTMPAMQEAVKLSTQGAFTSGSPKVGDSLDYVIQLEWQDTQVPVIVLAPDSVSFPGFKVLGQATVHKKLAAGAQVRNHTEFIYRLRAETQGPGKAASMKVRYLTGLSRQEEAIFVPTALIDILPAPVHILDTLWFKLLAGLIFLGGAVALAWASFRFTLRAKKKNVPVKADLGPEINALQNRLRSSAVNSPAASKEIIQSMESISILFLRQAKQSKQGKQEKGATATAEATGTAAVARFEPLLEEYLTSNGGPQAAEAQDWAKLRELFRHARFAGGHKEPHELQDAFRTFKRCLKITGEDQHD